MALALSIDDLPTFEDPETTTTDAYGAYTPSPADIRAACERIQRGWSPYERRSRMQWVLDRQRIELLVPTATDA